MEHEIKIIVYGLVQGSKRKDIESPAEIVYEKRLSGLYVTRPLDNLTTILNTNSQDLYSNVVGDGMNRHVEELVRDMSSEYRQHVKDAIEAFRVNMGYEYEI